MRAHEDRCTLSAAVVPNDQSILAPAIARVMSTNSAIVIAFVLDDMIEDLLDLFCSGDNATKSIE